VVLTFVPFPFIHPIRVARWRRFTLAMGAIGSLLGLFALAQDLDPPTWVTVALCAIGLYFFTAALLRQAAGEMNA